MFADIANRPPGARVVQFRSAAAPALALASSLIAHVALRGALLTVANSNGLSVEDMARDRYVVDSIWLSLQGGALVRDVGKRADGAIDVQH